MNDNRSCATLSRTGDSERCAPYSSKQLSATQLPDIRHEAVSKTPAESTTTDEILSIPFGHKIR